MALHRETTAASTRTDVYDDEVSVRMNSSMAIPIMNSSQPDSPSLYSMNTKPTYTRADPVSLWATIIAIGTRMTAAVTRKCLMLPIL